jgi:DNA mismatch repair protein MutS
MMKQYIDIKKKHGEEILFFRLGDFYEMFFDDAIIASKILDIALTSRQNDVPMCGIPYHAAESYISRLIRAGKKVAICEQMEPVPSAGGIVRREVVRVITPGTLVESNLLQTDDNNFLGSVILDKNAIGLSFVDVSTGDFFVSSIDKSMDLFRGEIARFSPREIVMLETENPDDSSYMDFLRNRDIPVYRINRWLYDTDYMKAMICEAFGTAGIAGFGLNSEMDIKSAGAILQYIRETHRKAFVHLKSPQKILSSDRMILDDATISNLELVSNLFDRGKNHTLFSFLNSARTPMGRRMLERNILQPLTDESKIEKRLDFIQYLREYQDLLAQIGTFMKEIYDIERIISRLVVGKFIPKNFLAISTSIRSARGIGDLLQKQPDERINEISFRIPDLSELEQIIIRTIDDNPANSPEQGRIIRKGFNPDLDRIYELKTNAKDWILSYEENEKKRLALSTLKVRYNRILGYYIEISKLQASNVPDEYLRKQTLVGSERYTTEKLQEFESDILNASEKIVKIEEEEISRLKQFIIENQKKLQEMAEAIGEIDFLSSLASAAIENSMARPSFNGEGRIHINDGRHPVVEKYFTREVFIPNDVLLDGRENIIKIITGPNMSGKSTYIRMAAIIQLMAQIGSFVPASAADLCIVDRIFTRIGASDNISRGESTFLVEMNETANILNNATDKSLIIMDEVGRGTSTYDGLSIAWAVVEFILRYLKSKTLFATHYHELTQLGIKEGIANYNVSVKEHLTGVDFLHKVVPGAADKSYGIHVAKLAGIPKQIIGRSEKILEKLEKGKKTIRSNEEEASSAEQLEIFNASNHLVIQAIKNINPDTLTPIDALNELNRLKKLIE